MLSVGKQPLLVASNKASSKSVDAAPSLAPMLDVVFLLLVFFVLSYSASTASLIEVRLPSANSVIQAQPQPNDLKILVDSEGTIHYKNQSYKDAQSLEVVLREAVQSTPNPGALITADARAPYQSVVTVLDTLGLIGVQSIQLSASPPEPSQ